MSKDSESVNRPDSDGAAHAPDLERFDLRHFIDALGAGEVDRIAGDTALGDIAALMEGNPRVVVVERPSGESVPLAGNVAASRKRLAQAFGTSADKLLAEVLRRLGKKGVIVQVARDAAPVQQVVFNAVLIAAVPDCASVGGCKNGAGADRLDQGETGRAGRGHHRRRHSTHLGDVMFQSRAGVNFLRRAMLLSRADPMVFVSSPISATMLGLAIMALVMLMLPALRKKREVAFAGD